MRRVLLGLGVLVSAALPVACTDEPSPGGPNDLGSDEIPLYLIPIGHPAE